MKFSTLFSLQFFTPLWYHEEIENAVRFLFIEIAKTYYGTFISIQFHSAIFDKLIGISIFKNRW